MSTLSSASARAPDQRAGLPPRGLSAPLHDLFLGVAKSEGYEEILACVLAAEWMYLTWCSTADKTPSSRPAIRDWVALHAGGAFADQVAWVRAEIDERAPRLNAIATGAPECAVRAGSIG